MGAKADRRRAKARKTAEELLGPVHDHFLVEQVIQCGLGDWAEGPVLLELFGDSNFLAVEPVKRYIFEAWKAGFRGPIIQAALWNKTGKILKLHDFRTRTSVYNIEDRGLGAVEVVTVTLDDLLKYLDVDFQAQTLLWMDCEGAETQILDGAQNTLNNTVAIVCELKDAPKFPNWPATAEMIAKLNSLGFSLVKRVWDDGLFLKVMHKS